MVEVSWKLVYSKQAQKDSLKVKRAGLQAKTQNLLTIISQDPWHIPPSYEKLIGNLAGLYSRRINIQHRLVYQVLEEERTVHVLRMWSHYE